MIDTVVFKIEDVNNNEVVRLLLKRLMTFDNNSKIKSSAQELKVNIINKREVFKNKNNRNYSGHIVLPSNVYDCYFNYNESKFEIEFNMSVPKSLFGTNVLMFISHSPFINPFNYAIDRSEQVKKCYDNLINYFIWFIMQSSGLNMDQIKIVLRLLIISRIDFCCNQVFDSRVDALRYIECLKRTKKKKSRDVQKDRVYDTTGVYYASENFTVKIYHKGTEFVKNDKKELIARGVYSEDIINSLGVFADKIVRYEMEFRAKYISQIYFANIFRRNDEYFKELKFCNTLFKKKFFELDHIAQIDYITKKQTLLIDFDLRNKYVNKYRYMFNQLRKNSKFRNVKKDLFEFRNIIKKKSNDYMKYNNKVFRFGIVQNQIEREFSLMFSPTDNNSFVYRALFSKDLFILMFQKFWEFVDEYDIKDSLVTVENNDTTEILERLFKCAGMENKRIAPYIGFYNLLQQGLSYKEIRIKGIYNGKDPKKVCFAV